MENFNKSGQYEHIICETSNDIVHQIEEMMKKVYEDLRCPTYEEEGFDDCFFSIEETYLPKYTTIETLEETA